MASKQNMGGWVWHATVEDDTESFFNRFERFADNYRKQGNAAFNDTGASAKKSAAAIGLVAGAAAAAGAALLNMAMEGGNAMINFTKESVLLAARVETLGVSLKQVGMQAGYTEAEIMAAEESVKDMGITTQAARQSLLLMTRANIDWTEASKLARVAQDAAVIGGMNSSEAFERLVRGIQKMEPELLDELGITLRRTDAYAKFAATVGRSVKELSRAEQQQAILNEIYEQAGVVAGSYEAAMGTAGKQAASMARHVEELQLAIGEAFQPVYQQYIQFMTEALKMMREFVEDNAEAFENLGTSVAKGAETAFTILLKLLEIVLKLAEAYNEVRGKAKAFVEEIAGEEAISKFDQWKESVVTAGGQVLSIIGGIANTIITAITEAAKYGADWIRFMKITLEEGVVAGGNFLHENMGLDRLKDIGGNIKNAFGEGTKATAEFLGILDSTEPSANKASVAIKGLGDSAAVAAPKIDATATSTEKLTSKVDNLARAQEALAGIQKWLERSEADRLRQEQRKLIEDRIAQSQQRADIEKRYQESIAQIQANAEKARADVVENYNMSVLDAHKQHSEDRLQAEEDYQDRLEQLKREFLYNSEDLARARDAIGMVRLIRENKRRLEEEQIAHDKRKKEIDKDAAERLEDLKVELAERQAQIEQNTAEQLEAARQAREDDYRNLEESLARQRAQQYLHDKWAAEDRRIAMQRQLQDWMEQYQNLEGVTTAALRRMIGSWANYYGRVSAMSSGRAGGGGVTDMLAGYYNGSRGSSGPVFNDQGRSASGVQDILRDAYERAKELGLIGQGGQVSSLLANGNQPQILQSGAGIVPVTKPVGSTERREIYIRVDGNGLDPYIQQQVVNTLYEIEQNRG